MNFEAFVKKIREIPTTSMSCRNFQKQSCQLQENKIVNVCHTVAFYYCILMCCVPCACLIHTCSCCDGVCCCVCVQIAKSFWKAWQEFEVRHGNEDTFREMLRIKRSVQAQFSTQVNFVSVQMLAAAAGQEAGSKTGKLLGNYVAIYVITGLKVAV